MEFVTYVKNRVNVVSSHLSATVVMTSTQPHDERGRFATLGDQPLSDKVRGVRLPVDVDQYIESMPQEERSKWMRKVLTEAAHKEWGTEQIYSYEL